LRRLETKLNFGNPDFIWDYSNVKIVLNPLGENIEANIIDVVEIFTGNFLDPVTYEITIDQTPAAIAGALTEFEISYDYNNTVGLDVENDRFGISTDNDDIDIFSSRDIELQAGDDFRARAGSTFELRLVRNDGQQDDSGLVVNLENFDDTKGWRFRFDGGLDFPDDTVQTTAFTGTADVARNIESENDVSIRVNLTDSTTRTWRFGEDGDLSLPGGGLLGQVWGDGVDTELTLKSPPGDGIDSGYVALGSANEQNYVEVSNTGVVLAVKFGQAGFKTLNFDIAGDLMLPGKLKLAQGGVQEYFQAKVDATGVVDHDCALGQIFYHTSPDANWTANFANLDLGTSGSTNLVLVVEQGATPYYPSAVQIGGFAQTIKWLGNVTPTPSANKTEIATCTIFNTAGTFTVLGSYSTYG
jgi:hypothetical protein